MKIFLIYGINAGTTREKPIAMIRYDINKIYLKY